MDIRSLMGGNAYEHYCHPDANMVSGKAVSDEEFEAACSKLQREQEEAEDGK